MGGGGRRTQQYSWFPIVLEALAWVVVLAVICGVPWVLYVGANAAVAWVSQYLLAVIAAAGGLVLGFAAVLHGDRETKESAAGGQDLDGDSKPGH